jgi:hypothetical protein
LKGVKNPFYIREILEVEYKANPTPAKIIIYFIFLFLSLCLFFLQKISSSHCAASAESWWVSQLARNPILLPYTSNLRHLDKVYLDTTFAIGSRLYATFPPKAEGIKELLKMIAEYPEDTIFYFRAWTFGYEDVWQALAAALCTTVCTPFE